MEWFEALGLLVGSIMLLMAIGMPVALAFLAANIIGAWVFMGGDRGVVALLNNGWGALTIFALVPIPLFLLTFGPMLGQDYATVTDYFARPFPALVAALTIVVGFLHFKDGVQVLIEDYVHGTAQKVLIIAMICLSYGAAATGLFAIARLAL